jgi:hypothetical protein
VSNKFPILGEIAKLQAEPIGGLEIGSRSDCRRDFSYFGSQNPEYQPNDMRVLSRKAKRLAGNPKARQTVTGHRLPKETLHPSRPIQSD